MDRRNFIKSIAAVGGAVSLAGSTQWLNIARAATNEKDRRDYDLLIPRVMYEVSTAPDQWNILPEGEQRLLREFGKIFRCRVKLQKAYRRFGKLSEFNAVVDFSNFPGERMYPFAFMTGQQSYRFNERQRDNLKRYVERGGFLLMDDCVASNRHDYFYRASYEMLAEMFGDNFVELDDEHEIFHNVFDIQGGLPCVQGVKHKAGAVVVDGRVSILLSSTDLHCGWIGRFFEDKSLFDQSIKMGINILFYALNT